MNLLCPSPVLNSAPLVEPSLALGPLRLLTDAERFALQIAPQSLLTLSRPSPVPQLHESRLPEVAALASILAMSRHKLGQVPTPTRLRDAADWLAARILLLELSHIALSLAEFAVLDQANQRCRAWMQQRGLPFVAALPVLVEANVEELESLRCWSAICAGQRADDSVALTRRLQSHCQQRLAYLLQQPRVKLHASS